MTAADGYVAKQRLIDSYGAAAKEEEMQRLTEQLAELRAKRDACTKVCDGGPVRAICMYVCSVLRWHCKAMQRCTGS